MWIDKLLRHAVPTLAGGNRRIGPCARLSRVTRSSLHFEQLEKRMLLSVNIWILGSGRE